MSVLYGSQNEAEGGKGTVVRPETVTCVIVFGLWSVDIDPERGRK